MTTEFLLYLVACRRREEEEGGNLDDDGSKLHVVHAMCWVSVWVRWGNWGMTDEERGGEGRGGEGRGRS